jgi:hypothetical protein
MTAHINVLVDSRTFKYCFNNVSKLFPGPLDGLLMTIDHFTIYTVYKVFYFMSIISKQVPWRNFNHRYFCNSYSNKWESKRFKGTTP